MEFSFTGGTFVTHEGDINYKEVLDDFQQAKIIRIITYNISKNQKFDALLDALKDTEANIRLITNIPSRMDIYHKSKAGNYMRSNARKNIEIYISKLDPNNFTTNFFPYFNIKNHAKVIGTENIVYIGSANYSNESANNIEAGILIKDKEFIKRLYADFFDKVQEDSLSYFDESFSAFRLFILSLRAKFCYHHKKLLENVYTDYERTKMVVADSIFIDSSDLAAMFRDLDELESICRAAEETYDEENEDYNDSLEQLIKCFSQLSIEWLKAVISEDGSLYKLTEFNGEKKANEILQEEYSAVAYDENLDMYVEMAMNESTYIYYSLHDSFSEEADVFLAEIEKILLALEQADIFTKKWKAVKVNPEIDNT
ncbi:MAG: phospholipase D-like domain-containing protein [Oscillospiraceae bacterium]